MEVARSNRARSWRWCECEDGIEGGKGSEEEKEDEGEEGRDEVKETDKEGAGRVILVPLSSSSSG